MARTAVPGTRERILEAVTPLFYGRGVRAVGMSEVVAAAGCGRNLVYRHFPGKDDLVAAYLQRLRETLDRAEQDALRRAGDDPRDQLLALVAGVAERVADPASRGCPFRNFLTEWTDHDSAPARVAREQLAASRARVDRLVGALGATDPAGLADRVWLVLDGLYAGAARGPDPRRGAAAVALVGEIVDRATAQTSPAMTTPSSSKKSGS
jgi:AcrR family transcriptional regulator